MQEEFKTVVKKGKATELSHKVAGILERLRLKNRMSQTDFAERIGVSFQQYQKYEKGRDRLSLEKAILLCSDLNLSLDIFKDDIEGFAEDQQAAFSAKPSLSDDEQELLDLFARIPKKNKQTFLDTVRQLAKLA
jgi:transcriptional regulator with XRE-family HTH domain